MSVETWKAEHYPQPAETVDPEDALEHCIKKWEGYTAKACIEHQVTYADLYDAGYPFGSVGMCALCRYFLHRDCCGCILHALGYGCLEDDSVYHLAKSRQEPSPMLEVLYEAREYHTAWLTGQCLPQLRKPQ